MKLQTLSRMAAAGLALSVAVTAPVPALSQDEVSEARVRKIESEIRALQRKVFPGGDARFFEPEINTAQQPEAGTPPATSTTAVTDILARLDAIEGQLQQLTATSEENRNAAALLEERVARIEASLNPPVAEETPPAPALMPAAAPTPAAVPAATPPRAAELPPARPAASSTAVQGPSADRLAGVQAITKPQTEDAGDDEYTYGFRLWNAGYFPEAQQQLSLFLDKYPNHPRATYGRNLLGRAYLDDGKAREAAPWFLRNYQVDKQAARAGDSLLFLAETMIALGDTNRACIALAEFSETYPALATGRLQSQYDANRQKVKCN